VGGVMEMIVGFGMFVTHALTALMFYLWGRWDEAAEKKP
jgi:hypothetical protein